MDWKTQLATVTINLVPVLVGALIAWVAGIFGAKYSHRLRSSAEKAAELRTKLEELVYLCAEIEHWADKQEQHFLHKGKEKLMPHPVEKILAIAYLYFDDLLGRARRLYMAADHYRNHLIAIKMECQDEKRDFPSSDELESLQKMWKNMWTAKEKLEQSARDLMETLLSEKHATNGWFRRWFGKSRRN